MPNILPVDYEILIPRAQRGDKTAIDKIIQNLERSIYNLTKKYYLPDGDQEDLMQEARLGILKAITDYQPSNKTPFPQFAIQVCAHRHICTAINHSRTKKHEVLNGAQSLDAGIGNSENIDGDARMTHADLVEDSKPNPHEQIANAEELNAISQALEELLTPMEYQVFKLYRNQLSYREIALECKLNTKAVDNALIRIRAKAVELVQSGRISFNGTGSESDTVDAWWEDF